MSDYLQRLVRRAVPAPYLVPEKLPEVRPATSLYGQPSTDLQADFDVEAETQDRDIEASQANLPSFQMADPQPIADHNQLEKPADRLEGGVAHNVSSQAGPESARFYVESSKPSLLDVQAEIELGASLPAIEKTAFTESTGREHKDAPAEFRNRLRTGEPQPAEISSYSGILLQSPDDQVEEALEGQIGLSGSTPQPALWVGDLKFGPGRELESTSQLEPQIPTPVEIDPSGPEPERVVIGSLTVEVLPAGAQPLHIQPAVQVTQFVPPASPRHSRSSKLRFGLGQM